jgi:uncharacterized protein (TIGR03382 family)
MWGGPPPEVSDRHETLAATNLGTQERGGVDLSALLKNPLPEIGLSQVSGGITARAQPAPEEQPAEAPAAAAEEDDGCGGCSASAAPTGLSLAALLLGFWIVSLRRRR